MLSPDDGKTQEADTDVDLHVVDSPKSIHSVNREDDVNCSLVLSSVIVMGLIGKKNNTQFKPSTFTGAKGTVAM